MLYWLEKGAEYGVIAVFDRKEPLDVHKDTSTQCLLEYIYGVQLVVCKSV